MSKITRMGIDLGKNTFHVCAMDRAGHVVMTKRFTRRGLEKFLHAHEPCVVGMEFRGDPEILAIFRDAGADVDGERVRFEPGMCRRIVRASAPREFDQPVGRISVA